MQEIQHPNIKLYLDSPELLSSSEDIIGVFHRWIQTSALPELLIDVANYAHVPAGPGILLVGHDSFYSIEEGPEERLGLLYNRRTKMQGTDQERLITALNAVFYARELLEKEKVWQKKLRFSRNEYRLILNDRYFAPNEKETFSVLEKDIELAFAKVLGHSNFKLLYEQGDPRNRFEVLIQLS